MIKDKINSRFLAVLVSIACVMQIIEFMIPIPVPGLKLGLANMIALVVLVNWGFKPALAVSIYRTVISSFFLGTFMTPTFLLSFSGALVSLSAMNFLLKFSRRFEGLGLSLIGISIVGALIHNTTQMLFAYWFLINNKAIFSFLPWLYIGALLMGWFNGRVATKICSNFEALKESMHNYSDLKHYESIQTKGPSNLQVDSLIHKLPPEVKIATIIILSIMIFFISSLPVYLTLLLGTFLLFPLSRLSFLLVINKIKKNFVLLLVALLFPVLFFHQGTPFYRFGPISLTLEGMHSGMLFSSRILFVIILSYLLSCTTSPEDLTKGFVKIMTPFRYFGLSGDKMVSVFSYTWILIPVFKDKVKTELSKTNLKEIDSLNSLISRLNDVFFLMITENHNKKE